MLLYNLWLILMGLKQNFCSNFEFLKLRFGWFKKCNSQYFSPKFQGLVLGLIWYIDAKSMNVAQPVWLSSVSKKSLFKLLFCFYIAVAGSSVLSKLWSFSIIHQLTLFWFKLMYYWKWPQFWKNWELPNCNKN